MLNLANSLISVIVPVYNVEKYLSICLESILKQTYSNLEILLINDGSTDSSGEICDQYRLIDSRIKVFHQSNCGIPKVRNRGVNESSGRYLLFVDSDDLLNLDFIEILMVSLINSNSKIAVGNIWNFAVDGSPISPGSRFIGKQSIYFSASHAVKAMYEHDLKYSLSFVVVTAKIYARELFNNLYFTEGVNYDDEFMNYKLLLRADKIVYVPNAIYHYLIRNDSITRSSFSLNKLDRLTALEERIDVLIQYNLYQLAHITRYVYFRELTSNIIKISKYFPADFELKKSLLQKQKKTGLSLLKSKPISFKSYIYILACLINPILSKFNSNNSL